MRDKATSLRLNDSPLFVPSLLVVGVIFWAGCSGGGPSHPAGPSAKAATKVEPKAAIPPPTSQKTPEGFRLASFRASDPVETIRVTLKVGDAGERLEEPVDLHLGLGFPLRLYPLGDAAREPAFAAFPQSSSLGADAAAIEPGESATFTYAVNPNEHGLDALNTTPQLLADITYGDIHGIGIASQGNTNWELAGYEIEINGELFASHDHVNQFARTKQEQNEVELDRLLPAHASLAREIADLKAYTLMLQASAADKENLAELQKQLAKSSQPINRLSGQLSGTRPWYTEQDSAIQGIHAGPRSVSSVNVSLYTGGAEQPGSQNPVYLWAGGRKLLLSSDIDPLPDDTGLHTFEITAGDLAIDPILPEDLKQIGVGMVGSDEPFDILPDRAKLQRVLVEADGQVVFDSDLQPLDRRQLAAVHLVPPSHRDQHGKIVYNPTNSQELHLWKSGSEPVSPSGPPAPGGTVAANLPAAKIQPEPKKQQPATSQSKGDPLRQALASLPPSLSNLTATKPASIPKLLATPKTTGAIPAKATPNRRSLYSPIRRKLSRLAGLSPIILIINTPAAKPSIAKANPTKSGTKNTAANSGLPLKAKSNPKPALKSKPAPTKPNIVNVRIAGGFDSLEEGDSVTVNWDVAGNTSQIEFYSVQLNPVLPHQRQPFVNKNRGGRPLSAVARRNGSGVAGQTLSKVVEQVSFAQAGVDPTQQMYLYMQPQVTGYGANNKAVLTSTGPIVPVMPKGSRTSRLKPGPFDLPMNEVASSIPPVVPLLPQGVYPGFQINGDGFGHPSGGGSFSSDQNRWLPYKEIQPGSGDSAWRINYPESSTSALTFAGYSTNMAITSASANSITVRFFQYPVDFRQNMHLVAHVGFISNNVTADASATVNVRVTVSETTRNPILFTSQNPTGPTAILDIASPVAPPTSEAHMISSSEVLRIESDSAGIAVTKRSANQPQPLQLIDVPILINTDEGSYRLALENARANSGTYTARTYLRDPVSKSGPIPPGGGRYVTATFTIKQSPSANRDAIGIFGTRLVPETK